jgi:YD repeat-containing protein
LTRLPNPQWQAPYQRGGWGIWPTSTTDVNTQTTSYTYDALGRMTSQTLPGETAGDTTTSWTYTVWCATTGAQTPCLEMDQTQRVDASHTRTTRAFYDGWGHLVETRTPGPGGQDVIVYADYDIAGRQVFKSNPYFVTAYTGAPGSAAYVTPPATPGTGTSTTYTNERVTVVKDALSNQTTTTLSTLCGVGSDTGCYSSATTVDPLGHQHITLADGLGRAAYDQTYTGAAGPYTLYATTSYGYDYNGNQTTIVRPDNLTISMTYDATGRETTMTDPDRGAESYSYDPNSNATTTIDARGSAGTIDAGYDGLNRQVWRNTTNSPTGAYVTYSFDTATNGVGRLAGETFANSNAGGSLKGCYAYAYDVRGRVTQTSEAIGTTTCTVGAGYITYSGYNDAGQLSSQTYPNGDFFVPSYDAASGWQTGLNVQLSGAHTSTPLLSGESYTGAAGAMGLVTSATLGGMTGGTGSYSATYDNLGRLTSEQYTYTPTCLSSTTLYQVQPTYDALGNVIESVTTLPQGVDTQVFCEDDLSRLTWAGTTGTPHALARQPPATPAGW